jgi:membrane-associated phospholipid phosphatase
VNAHAWLSPVSALGELWLVLTGTALTTGFLAVRRNRDVAIAFVIGIALCIALAGAMKLIGIVLERESLTGLIGSPSGHAALGTVFVGSIALVASHNRPATMRALVLSGTALATLAIAHSRVANGAHTPFETLEGLIIGLIGLAPLAATLRREKRAHDTGTVPAWPLVLIVAIVVAADHVFAMRSLDTEALVRLIADHLPISHN